MTDLARLDRVRHRGQPDCCLVAKGPAVAGSLVAEYAGKYALSGNLISSCQAIAVLYSPRQQIHRIHAGDLITASDVAHRKKLYAAQKVEEPFFLHIRQDYGK